MRRLLAAMGCLVGFVNGAHGQAALRVEGVEGVAEDGLALAQESLFVTIDDQYATSRIEQQYVNHTEDRLEGQYTFALGDGARVHGFAYWNGEQKIVGEVFEKDVAREVYEEVTGLGRDPGLIEQIGEGTFAFRVFPIEPAERKRIEVRFGQRLAKSGRTFVYRAPISAANSRIFVDVRDARRIVAVTSSTHEITMARAEDGTVRVEAGARRDKGTGSFAVEIEIDEPAWAVKALVHKDKGHDGYVVVTLATPPDVARAQVAPKDVTIVIDHSGSMTGDPMTQARLAAAKVVERLTADDRVNVIMFDDRVDRLYAAPKALTPAVRDEVLATIRRIDTAGGTDIGAALASALGAQIVDERPDVILFLTDGQSNAQAALEAARADKGDARLFTVGLGAGVEKPLLSRVAAMKRGRFTFIADSASIEAGVTRLFEVIDEPVLVDVAIDVNGARVERTYPRTLPDLTVGDELAFAARIVGDGDATVTVRGTLAGKPVEYTTSISVRPQARPWVGRVWAQARVEDLLEELALGGENAEVTDEVINLALAYNLITPYTSFLAIPEEELTEAAKQAVDDARERKKTIQKAHADAVALSRDEMPPGDPVLEVRAPRDAQQVTAYFPFGLVQDLDWDGATESWKVRFLVPKDVADGVYEASVVIVHADGRVELAEARYTIDSESPEFDVDLEDTDGGVVVRVSAREGTGTKIATATAAVIGQQKIRVDLTDRGDGVLEGVLPVPSGKRDVRIVVGDRARNESEIVVSVER